jgi:chaperonin GroEL
MNPMDLKRGIDLAVEAVVEDLKKRAKKVRDQRTNRPGRHHLGQRRQAIGKMIAEAMEKVGNEGVITVEEAKSLETELDVVEGMQFDRGYLSPYFVTNADKMVAELETLHPAPREEALSPAADAAGARSGRAVGQAAADHRRGRRRRGAGHARRQQAARRPEGRAVKAPGFGDRRKAMLEGHRDPDRRPGDLRRPRHQARERHARHARPRQEGRHRQGQHHDRRRRRQEGRHRGPRGQIRAQIEETTSDYDREKLQERLAKLAGGVAVIRVGGATEVEVKEKKDRVDDALHATRAAVEEGIVPAAASALLRASKALEG